MTRRYPQNVLCLITLTAVFNPGLIRKKEIPCGGYFRFRQEWPSMCSFHTSLSGQLCHVTRNGSPKQALSPLGSQSFHSLHWNSPKQSNLISLTPVELLPYLYIGDANHSSQIELLRGVHISAILNVSTSCKNHFPFDFRYKVIPVEDSSDANLLEWFQEAFLFIEREKELGGKVFVHCHGGISRSATVCLAYLMYTRHFHLDEAFEYVKSRRHVISPNTNFMMQLSQFEMELRNLGFIQSAASLQKPLSPRKISSVVSCPDMSGFLRSCIVENDDNNDDNDVDDDVDDDDDAMEERRDCENRKAHVKNNVEIEYNNNNNNRHGYRCDTGIEKTDYVGGDREQCDTEQLECDIHRDGCDVIGKTALRGARWANETFNNNEFEIVSDSDRKSDEGTHNRPCNSSRERRNDNLQAIGDVTEVEDEYGNARISSFPTLSNQTSSFLSSTLASPSS